MHAKEAAHLYHLYVCIYKEKKEAYLFSFVILCLGAEPSQFSRTEETPKRKAPSHRKSLPKSSETDADVELRNFLLKLLHYMVMHKLHQKLLKLHFLKFWFYIMIKGH